ALVEHFDTVISEDCPRFASSAEWDRYFEAEVDRVVLLMAHLKQAWAEAKQTPDKDVRRAAKAPRRELERGRALFDKLQQCAGDNGASFSPFPVWQRIEREIPRRQAEIALPYNVRGPVGSADAPEGRADAPEMVPDAPRVRETTDRSAPDGPQELRAPAKPDALS